MEERRDRAEKNQSGPLPDKERPSDNRESGMKELLSNYSAYIKTGQEKQQMIEENM